MTNIIKRNNVKMPATFGGLVDSVFPDSLSRFFDDDFWGFKGLTGSSQVPVNIRETDKSYEVEVVAPGLKKEDFAVELSDSMLTVSFERRQEKNEGDKDQGYLRNEYRMESFKRSFTLDDTVDAHNIAARYLDGILHLSLPKKEGAQSVSKTIKVE